MPAAVAGAVLANLASNAMADAKAEVAYDREQQLMRMQNRMNQHNALMAYTNQVQGAKLAGLSPAMLNGTSPQIAAPVTKGSAPVAENVEFDPASLLMNAQADNLRAQTAKLEAETPNVKADTELKMAETILKQKDTDRVRELTTQIRNANTAYADENRQLAELGQGMAQKWQQTDWYNKLAPDTKYTIDAIASGEIPLSVGGMDALNKVVAAQKDMSDADAAMVRNAFNNAVLESQFSDQSIMDAIARAPKNEQEHLKASKDKILAETERIKYKMTEFLDQELRGKKLSNEQLRAVIDAFKRNDLGYLKSQGEYGKWLEGYSEELLTRLLPFATGGALSGRMAGNAAGEAVKEVKKVQLRPEDLYGRQFRGPIPSGSIGDHGQPGVERFR